MDFFLTFLDMIKHRYEKLTFSKAVYEKRQLSKLPRVNVTLSFTLLLPTDYPSALPFIPWLNQLIAVGLDFGAFCPVAHLEGAKLAPPPPKVTDRRRHGTPSC